MRSYTKSELAQAAGVSVETFRRWLMTDRAFLEAHHVSVTSKVLPPKVVRYLQEKYDIDLPH